MKLEPEYLTACYDGLDNDGDGLIDLADAGCFGYADDSEGFIGCGLGVELALALLVLGRVARRRRREP